MKNIIYTLLLSFSLFLTGCADAGKDKTVQSNEKVTLDASQSTADRSDKISAYIWSQRTGPKVELSDKNAIKPTFIAPDVTEKTTLLFRLITKEKLESTQAEYVSISFVIITIIPFEEKEDQNMAPNAVISIDLEDIPNLDATIQIDVNKTISFTAEDSSDEDGEIVAYVWKEKNGTVLGEQVELTHTFTQKGLHSIELTVTDDTNLSTTTNIAFDVIAENDENDENNTILIEIPE